MLPSPTPRFSRFLWIGLVGCLVYSVTEAAQPPNKPATIELKTVKYDALGEAVRAQQGKVVVVDIWGFF